MKIQSKLLEKDIDFKDNVSPHDKLDEIVCYDQGADVRWEEKLLTEQHIVMKCVIKSRDGKWRVERYGEARPGSLNGDIAIEYPVSMASKRAFDNAAIAFLMLDRQAVKALYPEFDEAVDEAIHESSPTASQKDDTEEFRKVRIYLGKHRDAGYTAQELWEKDKESLRWLANDYTPGNEEQRIMKDACERVWVENGTKTAA